jgi:hypothetical protein
VYVEGEVEVEEEVNIVNSRMKGKGEKSCLFYSSVPSESQNASVISVSHSVSFETIFFSFPLSFSPNSYSCFI